MVTIAIVPKGTTPAQLARVSGMAVGLMSAGIGQVPPGQTFIDVGQGARINPVPLRPVAAADPRTARRPGAAPRIPPRIWEPVRRRAADAPAELVAGPARIDAWRRPASRCTPVPQREPRRRWSSTSAGAWPRPACPDRSCPGVSVVRARLAQLRALVPALRGDDLLIAIERPPPADESRARDRRGGRRHGRNAHLGLHPDARLRALRRPRSHDPRAARPRGPGRSQRRADRSRGGRRRRPSCSGSRTGWP